MCNDLEVQIFEETLAIRNSGKQSATDQKRRQISKATCMNLIHNLGYNSKIKSNWVGSFQKNITFMFL
jgi:hypothetical protein